MEGNFDTQDAVQRSLRALALEFARGIVNYSSSELKQIQGRYSNEISAILGDPGAETVVHRDNLALI